MPNQDLQSQIDELRAEIKKLSAASTIPYDVGEAFRVRIGIENRLPDGLLSTPYPAITAPTGGATVDSQSRSAINSIIDTLESIGLISPN